MFGVLWVLIVLAILGAIITVLTGFATTFRELAMLYGIGGWPGRAAVAHSLVWLTAFLYVGPPESDWVAAPLLGIVFLGTLCAPFYVNNRRLLETIRSWETPASATDLSTESNPSVPVSGNVCLDPDALSEGDRKPWTIEPVTSPFTATECAAYEWAVKKKQRVSRRTAYSTVEHGAAVGKFVLETATGNVGVAVDDPKLLLVFDGSFTGYTTTTDSPSQYDESPNSDSVIPSLRSSELKYCESPVVDGDEVTVVGPVERVNGDETADPTITDTGETRTYLIDAEYDVVKRTVEKYLRWTPHVAVSTLLLGWTYIGIQLLT